MTLLTEAERNHLAQVVAETERETAGEVVVQIVGRSDAYLDLRFWVSGVAALIGTEGMLWMAPNLFSDLGVPLLVAWFGLAFVATGWPELLRRLVPAARRAEAAHRRAQVAFVQNRVHRTRDASGVLILVSELEHRAEILADEGIHQRVGVEGWKKHLDALLGDLRSGQPARGLETVIRAIGTELAANFPPREDDENELEDHVRQDPE